MNQTYPHLTSTISSSPACSLYAGRLFVEIWLSRRRLRRLGGRGAALAPVPGVDAAAWVELAAPPALAEVLLFVVEALLRTWLISSRVRFRRLHQPMNSTITETTIASTTGTCVDALG
jgi:hypothetical protein